MGCITTSLKSFLSNLQSERLQVEVYYEVLCPDSRYFILHQLFPAWERVGDIMDIRFVPYGKASVSLATMYLVLIDK